MRRALKLVSGWCLGLALSAFFIVAIVVGANTKSPLPTERVELWLQGKMVAAWVARGMVSKHTPLLGGPATYSFVDDASGEVVWINDGTVIVRQK